MRIFFSFHLELGIFEKVNIFNTEFYHLIFEYTQHSPSSKRPPVHSTYTHTHTLCLFPVWLICLLFYYPDGDGIKRKGWFGGRKSYLHVAHCYTGFMFVLTRFHANVRVRVSFRAPPRRRWAFVPVRCARVNGADRRRTKKKTKTDDKRSPDANNGSSFFIFPYRNSIISY